MGRNQYPAHYRGHVCRHHSRLSQLVQRRLKMSHLARDPWVDVKTFHRFQADHVISALQKEIRRGNTENAALLAYEMIITSPALEDYLWQRLKVISVEDIGFGEPLAPVLIQSLFEMNSACDRAVGERK